VRYLIVSDIHSNWEALQSVLKDAGGDYDEILCLGDIVGYGADPNAVVEWARANVKAIVRGNHDKAATEPADMAWFNPVARQGALWTMKALSEESRGYIQSLPMGPLAIGDFQIAHGSPLDEDDYIVSPSEAGQLRGYLDIAITFFGHTHVQGGFRLHHNGVRRVDSVPPSEAGSELALADDSLHLINPGSVGQPRDGDQRAAYAIYAPDDAIVNYRRVSYDIEAAQRKIIEAGLPEVLAERLSFGG